MWHDAVKQVRQGVVWKVESAVRCNARGARHSAARHNATRHGNGAAREGHITTRCGTRDDTVKVRRGRRGTTPYHPRRTCGVARSLLLPAALGAATRLGGRALHLLAGAPLRCRVTPHVVFPLGLCHVLLLYVLFSCGNPDQVGIVLSRFSIASPFSDASRFFEIGAAFFRGSLSRCLVALSCSSRVLVPCPSRVRWAPLE
jgi:hypothetical protein